VRGIEIGSPVKQQAGSMVHRRRLRWLVAEAARSRATDTRHRSAPLLRPEHALEARVEDAASLCWTMSKRCVREFIRTRPGWTLAQRFMSWLFPGIATNSPSVSP
jgi:hypothetical protein